MRVLLVGNFLSGTGLTIGYCEQLASRLAQRGIPVVTTSAVASKLGRLRDMLATVWRRRDDYDVAHVDVFSGAAFVWAEAVGVALQLLRKPFVLTLRGGNLPAFAARWPRRVHRLLRSAAAVTAPSRYLAEALRAHAEIQILPNAVEIVAYPFSPRVQPSPRLIWLRSLHQVYNPALAVEVLSRIAIHYPEATLRMVGPDKGDGARGAVEARARELGVGARLTLVGGVPKSEVAAELARGDIFLNTTDVDNTPVSLLEAMASGLCVVSTNVGGVPYLVTAERDALLVPPRDADAMAAAVRRVLEEPGLAARLSASGHELAVSCDWSAVLESLLGILGAAARTEA